jgi:hypothetical protein
MRKNTREKAMKIVVFIIIAAMILTLLPAIALKF